MVIEHGVHSDVEAIQPRGRRAMDLNVLCDPEASAWPVFADAANESCGEVHRRHALQEYLVANYERLRQRLQRHLGCPDLASDSLHDAWLRLSDADIRAAVQSPEAYIYRMACNIAMDRLRSNRAWQYTGDIDAELEHLADETPGPAHIAAARSDLAAVERALLRLPRRHRSVLLALRIDEMSRQEVASRYALSLRTVDTALRQALDYCAEHAGQEVHTGVSGPRRAVRGLGGLGGRDALHAHSPPTQSNSVPEGHPARA